MEILVNGEVKTLAIYDDNDMEWTQELIGNTGWVDFTKDEETKTKDKEMNTKFYYRSWLEKRFSDLNVGDFDGMEKLSDDELESMVKELEAADVDLETNEGCDLLAEICGKYAK